MSAGDEIHVFHVVPSPQSKLLGAGIGLADAGEFMVTPPDPSDDKKQVTTTAAISCTCGLPATLCSLLHTLLQCHDAVNQSGQYC